MIQATITVVTFEPDLGKFCYEVTAKFPTFPTEKEGTFRLFETTVNPLDVGDIFEVSEDRLGEYLTQMHYAFHIEGIAADKRHQKLKGTSK